MEANTTSNMELYCKSQGDDFLKDLHEYFQIMRNLLEIIKKWNIPTVLILGKTGTGKSTLSREILEASANKERPFFRVNSDEMGKRWKKELIKE